jgi:hypothetical protein
MVLLDIGCDIPQGFGGADPNKGILSGWEAIAATRRILDWDWAGVEVGFRKNGKPGLGWPGWHHIGWILEGLGIL